MDFLHFILVMVIFALVFSGPSKEQIEANNILRDVIRFVGYCDDHKDELPINIRERFDEIEKLILVK